MATETTKKSFDLATLKAQDTADIIITNPESGEELTGVFVTVYGQDSDVYTAARRRYQAKHSEYKLKHRNKDMLGQAADDAFKKLIAESTKFVTGISFEGKEITSPEEAYNLPGCGWLFEQVSAALNDRSNFIKGLSAK